MSRCYAALAAFGACVGVGLTLWAFVFAPAHMAIHYANGGPPGEAVRVGLLQMIIFPCLGLGFGVVAASLFLIIGPEELERQNHERWGHKRPAPDTRPWIVRQVFAALWGLATGSLIAFMAWWCSPVAGVTYELGPTFLAGMLAGMALNPPFAAAMSALIPRLNDPTPTASPGSHP